MIVVLRFGAKYCVDALNLLQTQVVEFMEISYTQFGLLNSCNSLVQIVAAPVSGKLMDLYGYKYGFNIGSWTIAFSQLFASIGV